MSEKKFTDEDRAVDWCGVFEVTDILWDVDGDRMHEYNLPEEVKIPYYELIDRSDVFDVTIGELKDRIADRLSDGYEFCVAGFSVELRGPEAIWED